MKKLGMFMLALVMAVTACVALTGCDTEKDILVVCREASSGTREAFDKYVGLEAADITSSAEEYSSTGNVREKVANTATAIGYISLASVDDSVKALKIEGVEATADNVRAGTYKIQRPFLLLTKTDLVSEDEIRKVTEKVRDYNSKAPLWNINGTLPIPEEMRKFREKPFPLIHIQERDIGIKM